MVTEYKASLTVIQSLCRTTQGPSITDIMIVIIMIMIINW